MTYMILGAVLCFFSAIYAYIRSKKIINPLTCFSVIWFIVLVFSSQHLFSLYVPSEYTYQIILLGILAFVIGYIFCDLLFHKKNFYCSKKELRYNIVYLMCVVCITMYSLSLLNVLRQLGSFSLGDVQSLLQSGDFESVNNPIWNIVSMFFVQPAAFAIPAITAVDFWYGRRDSKLLFLTIIMILIRLLSSGNRSTVVLIFIYFVMLGFLKKKRKTKFRIGKRVVVLSLLVILGIILFIFMTISRGSSILRNVYLDFAMPPLMLEKWNSVINSSGMFCFGTASFNGLVYPLYYIISNIFSVDSSSFIGTVNDIVSNTDTQWQWIGSRIEANAYVSVFWSLYADGRFFGVILGMLLYGVCMSYIWQKMINTLDFQYMALYCLMFYGVLYSFARFPFMTSRFCLSLLFICFFYKSQSKEQNVY